MFLQWTVGIAVFIGLSSSSSVEKNQHPHSIILEPWSDEDFIEIKVPALHKRNPSDCEPYETEVYHDTGCTRMCQITGYIAGISISETHGPRTLSSCKTSGHMCRTIVASKDGLNLTTYGTCEKCECQTGPRDLYLNRRVKEIVKEVLSNEKTSKMLTGHGAPSNKHSVQVKTHSDLEDEQAPLRIRIPAPQYRNETGCEPYETMQRNTFPTRFDSSNPCVRKCFVSGSIGRVSIQGPARELEGVFMSNGTSCYIQTRHSAILFLSGARQRVRGKCQAGVCVSDQIEKKKNYVD